MLCLFLLCFVIDFIWCKENYIDLSQVDYFITEQFDKLSIKFILKSSALKIIDSNNKSVNNQSIECVKNETKKIQVKISNGTNSIFVKYNILCVTEGGKNIYSINQIFTETRPIGIYVGWLHSNVDEISDQIIICTNNFGEQYQQNIKKNSFILIGVKENVLYQICVATLNRKSITSTFKCTLVQYKPDSSNSKSELTNTTLKNVNEMRIITRDNINEFSNDDFYKSIVSPKIKNVISTFNPSTNKTKLCWEIINIIQGSIFEFIVNFINSKSNCEFSIHFQCENCFFPLNKTVLNKEDIKNRDGLFKCKKEFITKFNWRNLIFHYSVNYKNMSENYTFSIYGTNIFGVHKLYSSGIVLISLDPKSLVLLVITVISVVILFVLFTVKLGFMKSRNVSFCLKVTSVSSPLTSPTLVTYRNSYGKKLKEDVSILEFEKYYGNLLKNGQAEITKKFYKLKKESRDQESILELTTNAGRDSSNTKKNKFKNILPFDENRVKVGDKGLPDDYINASYIKSDYNNKEIEYIASQAPIDDTLLTFWQMIWEQNINYVVMLTQLEEGAQHKCLQYWPNNIGEKLFLDDNDQFHVILVDAIEKKEYCERKIIISKNDSKHRKIIQLHMNTWFDYSAPDLEYFDKFLFRFHEVINNNKPGPYLVHCSAGVGRTGTFICLDKIINNLINGEQKINIYENILRLRRNRVHMVQRKAQFIFIYDYINHFLKKYMIFNNNDEAIYFNQSQV